MAYAAVRTGSLKLKGVKLKKHKRKSEGAAGADAADALRYGVWWHTHKDEELVGTVFLEAEHGGFLSAKDDGTLIEAPPPEARAGDDEEEPLHPQPEDLFSIVRVSDNRIALKTAFGRYVSCDDMGTVTARMEAMGTRELWQPMWKDQEAGVLVLRGASKGYLFVQPEPGFKARADNPSQDDATMFRVWSSTDRSAKKTKSDLVEDRTSNLTTVEEDYTKKFQAGKVRLTQGDVKELKHARKEGALHEALLDRREKIKSDKFCK